MFYWEVLTVWWSLPCVDSFDVRQLFKDFRDALFIHSIGTAITCIVVRSCICIETLDVCNPFVLIFSAYTITYTAIDIARREVAEKATDSPSGMLEF